MARAQLMRNFTQEGNMKKLSSILLVLLSINASAIEVILWVSEKDAPNITTDMPIESWHKAGYHDGPCGWVQTQNVDHLPPASSKNYIQGAEKVYELDQEGDILNLWSMPVDSYVYAISGLNIYVRWGKTALQISTSGQLQISEQQYIKAKEASCPNKIKSIYGESDYIRCSEHTDLSNNKVHFLVYEGVCT